MVMCFDSHPLLTLYIEIDIHKHKFTNLLEPVQCFVAKLLINT